MSNLIELYSDAEFQKAVETSNVPVVLNFWASWAEPCKQMNDVFKELADKFPAVKFVQVSNVKLF
jgi:thiol-disulfide isomerase/thioredoxin